MATFARFSKFFEKLFAAAVFLYYRPRVREQSFQPVASRTKARSGATIASPPAPTGFPTSARSKARADRERHQLISGLCPPQI